MALELTVITELGDLLALEPEWRALTEGSLFRSPAWMVPWWHAYHRVLDARRSIEHIQQELRRQVGAFLEPDEKPPAADN